MFSECKTSFVYSVIAKVKHFCAGNKENYVSSLICVIFSLTNQSLNRGRFEVASDLSCDVSKVFKGSHRSVPTPNQLSMSL